MKTSSTIRTLAFVLAGGLTGAPAFAQTMVYAGKYANMGYFEKFVLTLAVLIGGFILVMGALALIAWVTSMVESLEPSQGEVAPEAAPSAAQPAAASAPAVQPVPVSAPAANTAPAAAGGAASVDTVAVITAAITAALAGRRFRIRQIRLAAPSPWGQVGRQSIQASHAIERKSK